MSAWTSRSPACSRRAWWCTRPIATKDGDWVEPADVKIEGMGDARRATLAVDRRADRDRLDRENVEVEEEHRRPRRHHRRLRRRHRALVHAVRQPPERDVIWTEEGVQGAWRFVQRLWRLVGEIADVTATAKPPGAVRSGRRSPCARPRTARSAMSPTTSRGCASTAASRISTNAPMRCPTPSARPKPRRRPTSPGPCAKPATSWCGFSTR